MLNVIITIAVLVVLVLAITKKYNVSAFMIYMSIVVLVLYSWITGTSMLGGKTTGSLFLDVFESFKTTMGNQMAGSVLTMLSILGYISYMNFLKATEAFAFIVSGPMRKLNKPYLLGAIAIVIGIVLKLALTSPSGLVALFLATLYPILRACRLPKAATATALVLAICPIFATGDINLITGLQVAGISEPDMVMTFAKYGVPMVISSLIGVLPVYIITAKRFDKKAALIEADEEIKVSSFKEIGVPGIYAILPALPIIIALIFSNLFKSLPTISYVAAIWLALTISMIVRMIYIKSFRKGLDEIVEFYKGAGNYLAAGAWIVIGAQMLSTVLSTLGGMGTLVSGILSVVGDNRLIFSLLVAIFMFFLGATTGPTAAATALCPLIGSYCSATGHDVTGMVQMAMMCAGWAFSCYPISIGIILLSDHSNTPITTLIRRNFVPAIAGSLMAVVGSLILFA
jgi:DcuC family C4-dicarboxylate transporter